MNFYELLTLPSDIRNVINSRLLTNRCSSNSGLGIISPINFIKPNVKPDMVLKATEESDICTDPPNRLNIVDSLATRDMLLKSFHKLWYDEYLLSLREQCNDLHQQQFDN